MNVIRDALASGPKSIQDLGLSVSDVPALRELEATGRIVIDPDMWPDEFVPGNPMVLRLPGDETRWPGWKEWNL